MTLRERLDRGTSRPWRREAPFGTRIISAPQGTTIATFSNSSILRDDASLITDLVNHAEDFLELYEAAKTRVALDLPNDHRDIELTAAVEALRPFMEGESDE